VGGGGKSEPAVVPRIAQNDGPSKAGGPAGVESRTNQLGGDTAAPMRLRDGEGGEPGARGPRCRGHRAERDMSDDRATDLRHQRYAKTSGGSEHIDEAGLGGSRKARGVDHVDCRRIARLLGPNHRAARGLKKVANQAGKSRTVDQHEDAARVRAHVFVAMASSADRRCSDFTLMGASPFHRRSRVRRASTVSSAHPGSMPRW